MCTHLSHLLFKMRAFNVIQLANRDAFHFLAYTLPTWNNMERLICSPMEGFNGNLIPAHRAVCPQCSSDFNGSCASDVYATRPEIRPIHKLGDKCYNWRDGKNESKSFQRVRLSVFRSKARSLHWYKQISHWRRCWLQFPPIHVRQNSNSTEFGPTEYQGCIIVAFVSILAGFSFIFKICD